LTLGQRIYQMEVEGYLVLPDLLSTDQIAALKVETATFDTVPTDYSDHQRGRPKIQFHGGAVTALVAHPPMIAFLQELFGPDIVMMGYDYTRSEPGHPGISLHADGQPFGSAIFGYVGSCPWLVRVLYYLDDLTPEVSPFRVVPRSHLCMHAEANPYLRYESHPEEVMVTAKAGSAVLINHRVFHGNFPNVGEHAREMLAIAYRPAWASPIAEVEEWSEEELAGLSADVLPFFGSRNQRVGDFHAPNKPANMKTEAPGMSPKRWERH